MKLSKFYRAHFLAVTFIIFSGTCSAENPGTPETPLFITGTTKVSAEQVIELANEYPNLTIVDSRIEGDRQKGYIESSISLPDIKTNCKSLAKVIPKKETVSLFYCNGVNCGRSVVAIKIALKCGYKNLYWFRGGFEVWLKNGLPYMKD